MDSFSRRRFVASIVAGPIVAVGIPTRAADVWTPPQNPDPSAILNEAKADTAAGRYEVALAKHLWYHRHALEYEPAQAGVRLSFALGYWQDLANKHPPALEKLKETRDEAGKKAVSEAGKKASSNFQDFVALNNTLDESDKSVGLFLKLRPRDPDKARRFYQLAEPALIRAKKYDVCGEYIDAENTVSRILREHDLRRKHEARFGAEYKRFAELSMTNASATLVGLLVVNDRKAEAEKSAARLNAAWDDKSFHEAIDEALTGKVPDPWP